MNKVLVIIVVFAVGALCGYKFATATNKTRVPSLLVPFKNNSVAYETRSVDKSPSIVADAAIKNEPDDLIKLLSVQTPKTQFERYREFQKLDQLSVDEIERLLMAITDSQLELRRQVAWFFSGKFPEPAFALMETSMGDNQMPLAQMLYEGLTSNYPEQVFDWLQNNENDFAILYPVAEQQFERKMALFQSLSVISDWKWAAYEAGLKLVKESMRPQDSWTSQTLAQVVAQANPMEAVDYALAQHGGAVDKRLLNGALIALGNTNPVEAKRLLVENQAHLDELAVGPVVHNLMTRGEFNEIYSLTDSLTDKKMVEAVVSNAASGLHNHGSEKVVEFIGAIKDPALKVTAVNSATSYMSVAGYPVEKQLEIIDGGLQGVPVDEKVFSYAWTIQKGYETNPQAMNVYLNQMKIHNKELAVKVEDLLNMFQESQKLKSPR